MDIMFPESLQPLLILLSDHPYAFIFVGLLIAGELVLLPAIYLAITGRLQALRGLRPNRAPVLACAEEPALNASMLGHVQQRLASDNQPARAPPGHQEQPFNLM